MEKSQKISRILNNYDLCEMSCSLDSNCLGIFEYYDFNNEHCNTLSNLGDTSKTNVNSYSYRKVYTYSQKNNHR